MKIVKTRIPRHSFVFCPNLNANVQLKVQFKVLRELKSFNDPIKNSSFLDTFNVPI